MAKAFIDLGLEKYGSVCILGFNSPEWHISNLAAIFAGGFATGIYPTNGTDACKYILEHSKCNVLVVEDQKQLDKIWAVKSELPNLKKIVQYTGIPNTPGVISWKVTIDNHCQNINKTHFLRTFSTEEIVWMTLHSSQGSGASPSTSVPP